VGRTFEEPFEEISTACGQQWGLITGPLGELPQPSMQLLFTLATRWTTDATLALPEQLYTVNVGKVSQVNIW